MMIVRHIVALILIVVVGVVAIPMNARYTRTQPLDRPQISATEDREDRGTPEAESTEAATMAATMAATAPATPGAITYTTIVIEGPVEQIDVNINVVVVYGQKVRLRKDDPIRLKIKVGDWIRIKGNFDHDENNQIIIIAIIVVIIDAPTVIIIVPSNPGNSGTTGNQGGGDGHHHHHDDDD